MSLCKASDKLCGVTPGYSTGAPRSAAATLLGRCLVLTVAGLLLFPAPVTADTTRASDTPQTSGSSETRGASGAPGDGAYELRDGQWVREQRVDPDSPDGKLQTVRRHLAQGEGKEAQRLAEAWIETYPNHPNLALAHLLLGDAKSMRGKYYDALFDYEYVIRVYPDSEYFFTALEREYEIARLFLGGMKRKFLGMPIINMEAEGEELLIRIQERAPGSELGERASLLLGDYYFDAAELSRAAEAYELFLLNYPESLHREWVMLRLIQANLARFRGPEFDPTGLFEARQRLQSYRREFPAAAERIGADGLMVRIEESLARKDYLTARWYERRGERVSAVYLYQRLIRDYPTTSAARDALGRLRQAGALVDEPADRPEPMRDTALPEAAQATQTPGADEPAASPADPPPIAPNAQQTQ